MNKLPGAIYDARQRGPGGEAQDGSSNEAHAAHAAPTRSPALEMRAPAAAVSTSGRHGPFVPLLLMGLAVFGWMAFQTAQLARERLGLTGMVAHQGPQIAQAQRLRAALSALASDTQQLADAGDPGAQLIVNQLHQRGITIHPGVPDPTPP